MQNQDKRNAGFPANKCQAESAGKTNINNTSDRRAPLVVPPYQGVELLDPSIIYAIQLTNAAADQIFSMARVLQALEPLKYCGYDEDIEEMASTVTSVVDRLIDFAAAYAKMSV